MIAIAITSVTLNDSACIEAILGVLPQITSLTTGNLCTDVCLYASMFAHMHECMYVMRETM